MTSLLLSNLETRNTVAVDSALGARRSALGTRNPKPETRNPIAV
jgi:hypothetical protein